MLPKLLCVFAVVGTVYLGLKSDFIFTSANASFRMLEMRSPAQIGQVHVDDRSDLFVPLTDSVEYAVPAEVIYNTKSSVTDGRRWHHYKPESGAKPVATLLLFHGAGRDGLSMIDMWRVVANKHNLQLVALDGRKKNWPQESVEPAILHRILDEVGEPLSSDREPVYLFGHSNGGAYVQRLLNEAEGPWRAAAIHAGFADPARGIIPAEPKPVRYYIGTREHIFTPNSARTVATGLAERGHNVDLQIIPQHTHWFYVAGPVIAADAWDWFSRQ
ncbi:MAG: hypothetical protein AAFO77_00400 [Pseudomonadota bacterium]